MRHLNKGRKLSRRPKVRRHLMRIMTTQLVEHDRIRTTVPKAKELRRYAEHIIRWGKEGTPNARKMAAGFLNTPFSVHKLFTELRERYKNQACGFTRILKCGFRKGDNAPMCWIEYVGNPLPPLRTLSLKQNRISW